MCKYKETLLSFQHMVTFYSVKLPIIYQLHSTNLDNINKPYIERISHDLMAYLIHSSVKIK